MGTNFAVGRLSREASVPSVGKKPGTMQLLVTPYRPKLVARARVSWITPPLEQAYM